MEKRREEEDKEKNGRKRKRKEILVSLTIEHIVYLNRCMFRILLS